MNSLGLSYGSSSDDDDHDGHRRGDERTRSRPDVAPPPVRARVATDALAVFELEGLPAEPRGGAEPETQARIARFLQLPRGAGGAVPSFQANLRSKKDVANPYILERIVEYFGIDELQTNFAPDVFDPHGLPLHEYGDRLAVEQKRRQDERDRLQLQPPTAPGREREVHFVPAKPN